MQNRRKYAQNDDEFMMEEVPNEGNLEHNAGELVGSATGENTHSIVPGGWEGTDDATSTEGSDLMELPRGQRPEAPEELAIHIEKYSEPSKEL